MSRVSTQPLHARLIALIVSAVATFAASMAGAADSPIPYTNPLTSPPIIPQTPVPTVVPVLPTHPQKSPPQIGSASGTLPTTVSAGRSSGVFAVSDSGASTYSIALRLPPGVGKVAPELALRYNSRSPNNVLGIGWSIGGLSAITRCNKSWSQDGSAGAVTLQLSTTYSDRFCLDGQQLKLTSSGISYGYPNSTYATELDAFSLIKAGGSQIGNGPASFTVTTKNGLIYSYGTTSDSQIPASGTQGTTLRAWALSQISDRVGNSVKFTYTNDLANRTYRIAQIQYPFTSTGQGPFYTASFSYSQRPAVGTGTADTPTGYLAGYKWSEPNKLDTITIAEASGTVIKSYNLVYAKSSVSSRLQLASVQECSTASCLTPTTISYQSGSQGWSSTVTSTGLQTASSLPLVEPLDLNGDGISDLLYPVASNSSYQWWVSFGNGTGFNSPINTGIVSTGLRYQIIFGNFSGGQRMQVLVAQSGTWYVYTCSSSGCTSASTGLSANGEYQAMDINGDGLPDLISVVGNTIYARLNTTTPGGAVQFASTKTAVWSLPTSSSFGISIPSGWGGLHGLALADFNGDGRNDLLIQLTNPGTQLTGASEELVPLLSNGDGTFTAGAAFNVVNTFWISSEPIIADWNGDGCSDVISTTSVGETIYLSDCTGGFPTVISTIAQPAAIAVDWDGDQLPDLLYNNSGTWYVIRSTGDGAAAAVSTGIVAPTSTSWFAMDADGDGLPDLGFIDGNNGHTLKFQLHNTPETPPDLALTFEDGLAMSQKPTYVPISRNNYTKGTAATFPEIDYQGPLYVVDQFTASDGTGSNYQDQFWYNSARIQAQGRGFEGFLSRRTYDTRNSLYTFDDYSQTFPYTGMLSGRVVMSSTFGSIDTWTSTLATQSIQGLGGHEIRYFPYLSQVVFAQHEYQGPLDGAYITNRTTNYTYGDGYGNPTQVLTTTVDEDSTSPFFGQSWITTVNSTYANDTTANWCLGLPTNTTVQSSVPGATPQTRTYQFVPDSTGALCRTAQYILEPTSPKNAQTVTVTLGYPAAACGNLGSVSIVGHNSDGTTMPTRTASAQFGTRCQLPETLTNELNQSAIIAYNYDFGVPTQLTDPNLLATKLYYDDFGRRSQETHADGTYSTYTYYSCNSPPCWGVNDLRLSLYRNDYNSDGTLAYSEGMYWDGFQRLRYDQTTHAFGTLVYDSILGYDSLSRVIWQYQPVASGSNGYTTIQYDPLDRIIGEQLYQNNGSLDRTYIMTHAGRKTTITDPLSHTTSYVNDVIGKLRRVTDPSPGGTTAYDYDAFGNLASTTDAIGATSTATYNLRGFRTQLHDADAGLWNFSGDSLNEMTSYFDGSFNSVGIAYDALGRMTSRSEPEGMSTWAWGNTPAAHDIGSLDSAFNNRYSEYYYYDNVGRLQTKKIISDATYQYDYSYNVGGYIDTITYPSSPPPAGTTNSRFQIRYSYSYTVPTQITDITQPSSTPLWALSSVNDYGSATTESLGLSLISIKSTYKAWTNEQLSIQSGVSGSTTNRQNLAYTWDTAGNLTERWDQLQNLKEDFVPDSLNRLSSSTLNLQPNFSVGYDASGNIKSRSDNGNYHYSATFPHQLMSTDSGYAAAYDNNGNVTSRNGLTQTWASFNLPTSVQAKLGSATYSSQFSYGPDRQRYLQTANYSNGTEQTSYVGGMLEKVSGSAAKTTYFRHYIPTPSGRTIVVYRNQDGSTSTAYALSDQLGSTDAVLDGTGNVLVRESFGAFGGRRQSNWSAGSPSSVDFSAIASTTRRGFTFHEELDNVGLTHMNGRVYDPSVGRFLSADPLMGDLARSQSVNPYAYVENRPLSSIDPTGLEDLEEVVVEAEQYVQEGIDFLSGGLFAFGGSPAPPPPAQALPGQSAQSGVQQSACGTGGDSAICRQSYIDALNSHLGADWESHPEVVVTGARIPEAGGAMSLWGLSWPVVRVVPATETEMMNVIVTAGGLPGHSFGDAFGAITYSLLIRPVFGLFECVGVSCSAGQVLMGVIGPPLAAVGGAEGLLARGGSFAARGLAGPTRTVIGKLADLKTLGPGERTLLNRLPNMGSSKANWAQNSSVLRQEMSLGRPIRDASVDSAGRPINNTGFLRMERNLLQNQGWIYDPESTMWHPPFIEP